MQKLKQLITNTRVLLAAPIKPIQAYYYKNRELLGTITNLLAIAAFTLGVVALIALMWLYVRPIKVADIKVPVATDQASYYPGEEISGIFFGEIYHRGEVRVLREVFCKDFHGIIAPPETARNGDFYDTQSIPRKIEGLNVNIGLLPTNVPVGANCVLQFTNVYNIQTPFGIRHVEYQYYTQNFSIVTIERRQQLECEAAGRKDCNYLTDNPSASGTQPIQVPQQQESVDSADDTRQPQNVFNDNRTTNNTTNSQPAPSEPAPRFEERCTFDFMGVKLGCRQEQVN
jgi:hypothetical protein